MSDPRRFVPTAANNTSARPIRVCFFFNAQRHQLLHGISTAVELSRRPDFDVHVASPGADHIAYAKDLAGRLGGGPFTFSLTSPALLSALRKITGASVPPKVVSLGLLARHLNGFDAIALPERTSLLLKVLGARSPHYIHLDHGAGDRAAGFDPRIRQFDMVLMAGEKHQRRLSREGLIRPGGYAVVGYPKFDAADAVRDPSWSPFRNAKPVVLYAPHFSDLGSWEAFGLPVLKAFAEQDRYNLIVAPHVRMLDGRHKRARFLSMTSAFARYEHMAIDPGSDRSIDMTYTALADVYLGDVSSQVYEFLRTPKPCVFLDAHGVDWTQDENYAHWRFGPVLRSPVGLIDQMDAARVSHPSFVDAQIEGFNQTFATAPTSASARAAAAIADYLSLNVAPRAQPSPRPMPSRSRVLGWAAGILVAMTVGWIAHDALGLLSNRAEAAVFVDEAVASHQTTLIRAGMRSQPEVRDFDPVEIRKATGINMPRLPTGWRVTDVQVYPAEGSPIVQVAALTERGEAISFVAMRINTPAGRTPILTSRKGDQVAYWEEGGEAYGIVGMIPAKRLLLLASQVAREF